MRMGNRLTGVGLLLSAALVLAVGATTATAAKQAGSTATRFKLVSTWGKTGTADGQFGGATGIGIDSQGAVYVADSNNYRIQKFGANGQFLLKWGTRGVGQGQFNVPQDVAIDPAGNVWVADYGNSRLQRFTTSGGSPTDGKTVTISTGLATAPDTIATDAAGNVYVADFGSGKIRRFDVASNWGPGPVWGGTGTGAGQFNRAHGIATSPDGSVYVGDRDNYRTQRFDTSGKFLNGWGTDGVKPGQFRQVVGAAVDLDCNVWMADSTAARLQKFSPTGKLLDQITSGDARPFDVAVGPSGDIYTLETSGATQSMQHFRETPGPKPANAPKTLDLRYDKATKTFLVSVAYTIDNIACPTSIAATASLKTATGRALGTKAGLQLAAGKRTTIDIPLTKAAILGAGFKTFGSSFKVALTKFTVILKTNGHDTIAVKNGALRISIAAIKSGALPGLSALAKR
jgi:sugar lactone lactonase YvrE